MGEWGSREILRVRWYLVFVCEVGKKKRVEGSLRDLSVTVQVEG